MAEISSKKGIAFASLILFSLIFLSFAYAANFESNVTPTSINEDTNVLLNFTINNTDTAENITQVNITLPTGFSFVKDSNGTTAPDATFSNTTTTLNWTNTTTEGFIKNGTIQSFWFNVTASEPGKYNVTIDTLDTSNSLNSTNVTITVNDTTAPSSIEFVSPTPDNNTNLSQSNIEINVTAEDNGVIDKIVVRLFDSTYNQINSSNSSTSLLFFNFTELSDGVYYFNATVNDTYGNSNSTPTRTVTLDTTAPEITLDSPDNETITNSNSIDFNFTASDAFSTTLNCSLIINGTLNTTNTSVQNNIETNFTLSGLSDGNYNWIINCTDEAGNENASETRLLTVDTTAPEIVKVTLNDTSPVKAGNVTFNLTFNEVMNASITPLVKINGTEINETGWEYDNKTWLGWYNFTTETGDGNYTINITRAKDIAGNEMVENTSNWFILDTTAPEITLDSPDNETITNSNSIDFNFTASDAFSTTLNCSLIINGTIDETNTSVQNNTETNFTLSELSDGNYNWSINCTDEAGNENASETRLLTVDTVAPEITLISPANLTSSTTDDYNFTFNVTDANNVSNCSLIFDGSVVENLTEVNTSETNGIYYSSLSIGTHTWSINCTDIAGNENESETRTLIVKAPSSRSSGTTYPTYRIDEEELSNGYQKVMRKNWRILFRIDGESHTFKVEDVTETTAKISISSETQEAILSIGEEKKFEITGDDYYDILVRLNSIDSTNEIYLKADFTIQSIHEEIVPLEEEEIEEEITETEEIIEEPIEEEPIEEEETIPEEIEEEINETIGEIPQETIPEPEKEKMNLTALWIAMFVIVILIIFMFIYRRSGKE